MPFSLQNSEFWDKLWLKDHLWIPCIYTCFSCKIYPKFRKSIW